MKFFQLGRRNVVQKFVIVESLLFSRTWSRSRCRWKKYSEPKLVKNGPAPGFLSANGDHLVQEIGLATQMYASQWFLTLFAAKFPLFLVFRVLDVFLLHGADVIFQVTG